MTEYIEREAAIRVIQNEVPLSQFMKRSISSAVHAMGAVCATIDTIPAADVRPVVRGEWIVKQTAIGKEYTVCSACNTGFKFETDKGTLARLDMRGMPYCPNCGADMRGKENE